MVTGFSLGYWANRRLGGGSRFGSSSLDASFKVWKSIWRLKMPNKVKALVWRACFFINSTLPFFELRKIRDNGVCFICNNAEETVLHALWECTHARQVWKELEFYSILRSVPVASFKELCFQAFSGLSQFQQEVFTL